MAKTDYYEVLGVARGVDAAELKRAYRELAMRWHPDKNPGDAEAEDNFKRVSEAYAVLSDPEKRMRYDRLGHAGGGAEFDFSLAGFVELFESLFGDLFGGRKAKREQRRGGDLRYNLELDFVDAAMGCEKTIRFPARVTCEACGGIGARGGAAGMAPCSACSGRGEIKVQQGFFSLSKTCVTCGGKGRVVVASCPTCQGAGLLTKEREYGVKIPPATDDGAVRRVSGQGEPGRGGAPAGDLHVHVKVKPHPLLKREGRVVVCELPVSMAEAALGTSVSVPTLDGIVEMRIPPGAQSGTIFRLRGKGLPLAGPGSTRGDAHVRLLVETPVKLDRAGREAFAGLAALLPAEATPQRVRYVEALREHEQRTGGRREPQELSS